MIHIPTEKLADFEKNIRREWTMTNGIGGYAGGSIIGACNRTHQGYLIASLHPPVERYLVFSKTKTDTGNPCLQSGNFPACRERTFSHPHARTAFFNGFLL